MKRKGEQWTWIMEDSGGQPDKSAQTYRLLSGAEPVPTKDGLLDGYKWSGVLQGGMTVLRSPAQTEEGWMGYATGYSRPIADQTTKQIQRVPANNQKGYRRETTIEQKLFGAVKTHPEQHEISVAIFSKDAAVRGLAEGAGMIKNAADARGAEIVTSDSLSKHSAPLVGRMAEEGLVNPKTVKKSPTNNTTFIEPTRTHNAMGHEVPAEEVEAGMATTRSVMRDLSRARRSNRPETGPSEIPGQMRFDV